MDLADFRLLDVHDTERFDAHLFEHSLCRTITFDYNHDAGDCVSRGLHLICGRGWHMDNQHRSFLFADRHGLEWIRDWN